MAIKLPHLTWVLDCEPIGYPGLTVEFWLNPPVLSDAEAARLEKGTLYDGLARVVERIQIPGAYTDTGEAEIVEGTAAALRELDRAARSDPQLLVWASMQYRAHRSARMELELKN